jgi:hypothetical protein
MRTYDIVTIDGDGIGPEVCQSAITVLREACGERLRFTAADGGAAHYPRPAPCCPTTPSPPAAMRMPSCTARPACRASPTPTAPRSATTCTCACASGSTCMPTCGRSGCCAASRRRCRAGAGADRLRDRAREHRRPVRQPRRRREPARRGGHRYAGDHAQGRGARGALQLRAGAPPPRCAARRQAPRDGVRQGQHPAQLCLLPRGVRRGGRGLPRRGDRLRLCRCDHRAHAQEARLLRRDRGREHVRRHHLRPGRRHRRRPGHRAHRPRSAMRTACSRARMARRPTSPGRTWPARWPPSCRAR